MSRAAIEIIPAIDFKPDVIHANDWQTALTPIYYKLFYQDRPEFAGIKTVFTIHNIQYQGKYGMELLEDVCGLPKNAAHIVEYDKCVNFMKGAIEMADAVTTVSPSYAQEILDPWFSHGLDPILAKNSFKLSGILNGIDVDNYNPATDNQIYANLLPTICPARRKTSVCFRSGWVFLPIRTFRFSVWLPAWLPTRGSTW